MDTSFKFVTRYIREFEDALKNISNFYAYSKSEKGNYVLQQLNQQINFTLGNSSFYKNLYKKESYHLKSLDELRQLPFITKQHLRENGNSLLTAKFNSILKYGETTGTSGKPVGAYVHLKNWIANSVSLSYLLSKIFDENDVVAIAIPYELSFAAQDIDSAFQIINSTIISTGSLSKACPWTKTLDILHRLPVNVLTCSPTRIIRLATLAEENSLDPKKDFNLNKFICVGESFSSAKAQMISNIWGGASVYSCYGTTETNALAVTCKKHKFHCIEERFHYETIDPETGLNVKDGEIGELVISSLDMIAIPLIRYRTGDLVIKETKICECGLDTSRLKLLGRIGDNLVIGDLVFKVIDLENSLLKIPDVSYLYCFEQKGKNLNIYLDIHADKLNTIRETFIDNVENTYGSSFEKDRVHVLSWKRENFVSLIDNSLKPGNALIVR